MSMTLAESMAIAVLKGDMLAAYALADRLLEQRDEGADALARAAKALRETPTAGDGYGVYRWPEFQAFCKRAGILWDLRTVSMTITLREGELAVVDQQYAMSDDDQRPPNDGASPVDTTTAHNEEFRTFAPRQRRPPYHD